MGCLDGYPDNWEALAWACKERAGWQCERCGVAHGASVVSHRTGQVYTVHLAAAHLYHDPATADPVLRALCQACHLRYDTACRLRAWRVECERMRHQVWLNVWASLDRL